MTPPVDRIRNIAVGLIVRDGHALVEVYPAANRHRGHAGHEVVHAFSVACPELDSLPPDAALHVLDSHTTVRWLSLDALRAGDPPFYPVGMSALAESLATASRP